MYKLDQQELLKLGISMPTVKALANLNDTSALSSEMIALIAAELSALRIVVNSFKSDIAYRVLELEAPATRGLMAKSEIEIPPQRREHSCNCKYLQEQIDEIQNKLGY